MLFLIDLLLAFIVALLFALLLSSVMGWRHPAYRRAGWADFIFLFVILLLFIWAGGVWITPVGPTLWGAAWLPFVLIGLIVSLLLAALAAPGTTADVEPAEAQPQPREVRAVASVFGVIFWVLLLVLLIGIIVRYMS